MKCGKWIRIKGGKDSLFPLSKITTFLNLLFIIPVLIMYMLPSLVSYWKERKQRESQALLSMVSWETEACLFHQEAIASHYHQGTTSTFSTDHRTKGKVNTCTIKSKWCRYSSVSVNWEKYHWLEGGANASLGNLGKLIGYFEKAPGNKVLPPLNLSLSLSCFWPTLAPCICLFSLHTHVTLAAAGHFSLQLQAPGGAWV